MKKKILSLLAALIVCGSAQAQLFGTYNVPGSFPTLAAAITSLNAAGVGGPITINVAAGYTEVAPAGGYNLGVLTGASAVNTVTIRKFGIGANPLISAPVGANTPASATQDGVFRFIGTDWVVIDGIDIVDNNASGNALMEFGYGFFKASVTDGCQNNIIRNCTITLKAGNNAAGSGTAVDGSRGIDMVNALSSAHTTALTITSANGAHSNNKIYNNLIQNCNVGISVQGFNAASPFTLADTGNDIGGSSAATSNTITNFGGGGTTSPASGIAVQAQHSVNISYNVINNNTSHNQVVRGIVLGAANTAQGSVTGNTITLRSAGSTHSLSAIANSAGVTTSNTLTINNNLITGCSYTTATTGVFNAIINQGTPSDLAITGNTISATTHTGTAVDVVIETGAAVSAITNSNVVTTFSRSGASGAVRVIKTSGNTNWTANGNTIDGVIWTTTNSTGSISAIYDANSGVNLTITNNVIRNMALPGNGMLEGIRSAGAAGNKVITNNQVYSFSTTASGTVESTFIGIASSIGTATISGNQVYSLTVTGGTVSTVNGILIAGGTTNLVTKNKVYDIGSTSRTPAIALINVTGGTTNNIFNNLVGSAIVGNSNGTNAVIGININGGTTNNVYFNTVNLAATSTGTTFGSSALFAATSASLDLRNNILVNTSSTAGAGLTVAFRRSSTTLTTLLATSNNNLLFAGTPAANQLLYADGTNNISLLTPYKVLMATRDQAAVTENPPFASTTGSNANFLNINTAVATQIEGGALPVSSVTDDYAGTTRNATTPDIGAWEGGFTPKTTCAGAPAASNAVATTTAMCTVVPFNVFASTSYSETSLTYQWLASTTGSAGTYNAISNATTVLLTNPTPTALTTWYALQVTCPASGSVTVSAPVAVNLGPIPTATAAAASASVCWNTTVALSGSSDIGTSYAWTGPSSYASSVQNPTITGPASGVYSLVVTAGSCTSAIATVTLTQLGKNFTNSILTNTNTICATTGTVALSFTLDPVNPTYAWSPSANLSSSTASAVTASLTANQVYSLDLSYQGCTQTKTIQINVGNTPTMVVAPLTSTVCAGTSVTLTASGVATYSWNTAATTSSIVVTPTVGQNVYTVNGGSVGCVTSQTVGVTVNANPTVTISGPTGICAPDAATLTASGATSYTWSTGDNTNTVVVTPTVPTQYTVTGSDANNCRSSVTRYLNVSTSLALNGSATPSVCAGVPASIIVNGADTYSWSNGATTNSISVSPTVTTSYSVLASAGSCTGAVAVTISVTPMPTLAITGNTVICVGQTTTLSATGATTYSWSTGSNSSSLSLNPTVNTNYTLTGANANCISVQTLAIVANTVPVITVIQPTTSVCFSTAVTFTATGANTYTWTNGPQTASFAVTPTATAVYTVVGTSPAGCVATRTISQGVFALPNIVVNPASPTLCIGAPSNFTATGATSYTWNGGAATGNTVVLSASGNTVFSVTGTNANGCVNTTTVNVLTNTVPIVVATPVTQTVCAATATSFTASGANNYSWSNGNTGSVGIVSTSSNTTYTVTGTNTTGCSASTTVAVVTLSLPIVSVSPATITACLLSQNSFTASGATTYSWTTGATGSVAVVTPTAPMSVIVVGTDNNNCSSPVAVTILTYSLPAITVTKPTGTVCANSTGNYTATGADTYTWSTNANGNVTPITPSATAVYSVSGSNTLTGCSNTATFTINTFSLPVITVSPSLSQTVCHGASATFTSSGAITYTWTGGTQGSGFVATPTANTIYTVNGKNQQGCIGTNTVSVKLYSLTVVTASASSYSVCAKETVTMTANGAASYTWMPFVKPGTTYTVVANTSFKYYVIGVDANNCEGTDTVMISVDKCTGLAENNVHSNIRLYPNPTNGKFVIDMPFSGTKEVVVLSSTGAMITTASTDAEEHTVDLSGLSKGIYFINVKADGKVSNYRMVVQE